MKTNKEVSISELTPEQLEKYKGYVDRFIKVALNNDPCDLDKAKDAVKRIYKYSDLEEPKFFIGPVNNPYEAGLAQAILEEMVRDEVDFGETEEDLNKYVLNRLEEKLQKPPTFVSLNDQIYGNQEYWQANYLFIVDEFFDEMCKPTDASITAHGLEKATQLAREVAEKERNLILAFVDLAESCGWLTPLSDIVILQHRPKAIHLNAETRLHNENGPALEYRGSPHANLYAVNGVNLKKKVIDRDFTWQDIENEPNAEVRRVMIDFYTPEKYIVDSGAEIIHSDDFGTLYRKELQNDEVIMMVKVVNSTAEPDGSFKDYWLRVDPSAYGGIKYAKQAVASTWRDREDPSKMIFENWEDYSPAIET